MTILYIILTELRIEVYHDDNEAPYRDPNYFKVYFIEGSPSVYGYIPKKSFYQAIETGKKLFDI